MKIFLAFLLIAAPLAAHAQNSPGAVTTETTGRPAPNARTTSFVADASVKNVFGGKGEEVPAAGSLGMVHTARHDKLTLLFTVASSVDTIRGSSVSQFGSALLSTGSAGPVKAPSFSVDYQRYYEYSSDTHQQFGARGYFGFTKATWRFDSSATFVSADLSMLSYGARLVWTAINNVDQAKGNDFAATFEAGWTFRTLGGDVVNDTTFMRRTLGVTNTTFHGPEGVVSMQLRQLTAIATMPLIGITKKGSKVNGLTGFEPTVEFKIHAPFLTL